MTPAKVSGAAAIEKVYSKKGHAAETVRVRTSAQTPGFQCLGLNEKPEKRDSRSRGDGSVVKTQQ